MREPNFFANGGIDRRGPDRGDEAWLAARLADPSTRIVPVWRSCNLMVLGEDPGAVLIERHEADLLVESGAETAFLGMLDDRAHFAVELSHIDDPIAAHGLDDAGVGGGEFVDLRNTGGLLDPRSGALLAYARGLMFWHKRHRHCGACGHPTHSTVGGHVRVCANADCALQHFPRTDPAVIMLVTDGDRCLLGKAPRFIPGMYSTLAGFVEPGESLEEAVAREVYEEAGIRVTDVRYHSSQPWPFPASIMLGFHATATTTEISLNDEELADAVWKTREELINSPEDDIFRLPRGISIARRLVDDWIEGKV
jgi:NAD+ diphosphatase